MVMMQAPDVTQMLQRWTGGDRAVEDELLSLLYAQLKGLAHARLQRERPGHTLNTTALVHEAYLKLIDINRIEWKDRAHFLAMASRTMRRILIDYALRRKAQKRGGGASKEELDEQRLLPDAHVERLLELNDVLKRLEATNPRQSSAVELYYFGGLKLEEVGEVLDVSPATAMRDLRFAEAWLAREWKGDLDLLR